MKLYNMKIKKSDFLNESKILKVKNCVQSSEGKRSCGMGIFN